MDTVTSRSVFLVRLGSTAWAAREVVVGINRINWIPRAPRCTSNPTNCSSSTPATLIVTRAVRDPSGTPVRTSRTFLRFLQGPSSALAKRVSPGAPVCLAAAGGAGSRESQVISASVFTTQSVTAVLEKIRDQIKATTPEPADFNLGPGGTRTVFPLSAVTRLTWNQHTRVDQPLTPVQIGLGRSGSSPPARWGTLVFGKFLSPDYQIHPQQIIPPVGTRTGTPAVQGINEIYFNLVPPSGPRPPGGWPVAIYGHGSSSSKESVPLEVLYDGTS